MTTHRRHVGTLRLASVAGTAALLLSGVACSGALDVPNPQAFGDDALNNSIIIKNVTDGAEGVLMLAYDDMIVRLRLKQAFGRLVRRADDTGVFVLLDPRLPSRLATAFPDEHGLVSLTTITQAIAAFERTLLSGEGEAAAAHDDAWETF